MTMPRAPHPVTNALEMLQAELPDLAYDLERQGRLDAADVVMMLHARVRELASGSDLPVQQSFNSSIVFIPHQS